MSLRDPLPPSGTDAIRSGQWTARDIRNRAIFRKRNTFGRYHLEEIFHRFSRNFHPLLLDESSLLHHVSRFLRARDVCTHHLCNLSFVRQLANNKIRTIKDGGSRSLKRGPKNRVKSYMWKLVFKLFHLWGEEGYRRQKRNRIRRDLNSLHG